MKQIFMDDIIMFVGIFYVTTSHYEIVIIPLVKIWLMAKN